MNKITEDTLLPLSLVITLGTAIYWASGVATKLEAASVAVSDHTRIVQSIDRRLSRIEGRLDIQEAKK